ncbi:hypothetical protein ABL840_23000 [Variovorax sp. NFACC27]|uniref:hypothetical protein n=1 Tax=unclassified Variovorax TaxID=663243 RepID=UPI00089D2DCC|nr:hypothetical protein SAMN03159371_05571 [Variovorax sp. NFACC28]SEG82168.1 hypothetical protein SAMN03159365_04241 [Variovorax sp. NFACC29]SFD08422.1 hypothetical protein SAMN03159379_04011 [Variovorax sp. NFACC26]SFG19256.1 hypothetical protein SAMN03159447_02239 [Variovorax sp. NFACC27]
MKTKTRFALLALLLCSAAATAQMTPTSPASPAVPQFKDYPADAPYTGKNHPLVLDSDFSRSYRTRLREAIASSKPSFAGRYIVTRWGCGTGGCNVGAVIDASTGHAISMPNALMSVYPLKSQYEKEDGQELIYKLSSRLLVQAGDIDSSNSSGKDVVEFYELRDGEFRFIRSVPYGRADRTKP